MIIEKGKELGISIRGGIEHGLGIYISSVEADSVAESYGLKVTIRELLTSILLLTCVWLFAVIILYRLVTRYWKLMASVFLELCILMQPRLYGLNLVW